MHWHGLHPVNQRPIYSVAVADFAEIRQLKLPSPRTIMLIAADTREVPVSTMGEVTETLLDTGLIEAATWGPDCERLHDIFDESYVGDATVERTEELMTNWFAKVPLHEALFYFIECTRFEDSIAETVSYVAISVAHAEWAEEIRQTLTKVVNGDDWRSENDAETKASAHAQNVAALSKLRRRPATCLRYCLAFLAGLILYGKGLSEQGELGIFGVLFMAVIGGGVSAIAVGLSALIGQTFYLHEPSRWHLVLAITLITAGLTLYAHGIEARTLVSASVDGGNYYELGATFRPGYALLMLGLTNVPLPSWSRRQS